MRKSALFLCFALLVAIVFLSGCSGNSPDSQVITTSSTISGNNAASDLNTTKPPLTENSPVVTPTTPFVTTVTTSIPVRLTSGTFLKKTIGGGFGEMSIINRFKEDAVVIITRTDSSLTPRDSVYVQSGGYLIVPSFPNGEYNIYFMTGTDWNSTANKFNRNVVYKKFIDSARFSSEGNRYQIWKIGIGSTDTDAKTEEVSEKNFPS